jgi:PHD/YefM family antitoxin component YafN of YafNO toxin-antitoxin module
MLNHYPGKYAHAVLLSADDWRAIQETLFLVSIPAMQESILEGMKTPIEECATELDSISLFGLTSRDSTI